MSLLGSCNYVLIYVFWCVDCLQQGHPWSQDTCQLWMSWPSNAIPSSGWLRGQKNRICFDRNTERIQKNLDLIQKKFKRNLDIIYKKLRHNLEGDNILFSTKFGRNFVEIETNFSSFWTKFRRRRNLDRI